MAEISPFFEVEYSNCPWPKCDRSVGCLIEKVERETRLTRVYCSNHQRTNLSCLDRILIDFPSVIPIISVVLAVYMPWLELLWLNVDGLYL